ncbi:hypothetical protein BH09DEP1_BH09DEP1_0530 [soil metagenome]
MDFSLSSFFIGHRAHLLLFATISLILGITVAFLALPFWVMAGVVSLLCIPTIITYYNFITNYSWLALPISFVAGIALYHQQVATHFAFQNQYNNVALTITGTVASVEKIQNARHRWHMVIDLTKVCATENEIATTESIALYSVWNPQVMVGDTVQITNVTFKKIENRSFNLYLAKEKVSATAFIDKPTIIIMDHPKWSLNRSIALLRNKIFGALQQTINKETFALFSSIFLGNRVAVKQQMDHAKEPFKYWGTSHYLARSGLHLVIFGIIWHFILGFLPLVFFWKQVFLILLITCYSLLSWSSISFNRALIMFFIAKFCLLTRNRLHYVHLITLATCLVLIFNPLQLFYLDFQLSFGLTFALAWFTHIQQHKKCD